MKKNNKQSKKQNPDQEFKKTKYYNILIFNNEDAYYALYTRRTLQEAQILANEKLACPQVRSVQINEVVKWESVAWSSDGERAPVAL